MIIRLVGLTYTNVISEMGPETVYYIHVVGVVHESVSGITFSVDKEFSNR